MAETANYCAGANNDCICPDCTEKQVKRLIGLLVSKHRGRLDRQAERLAKRLLATRQELRVADAALKDFGMEIRF